MINYLNNCFLQQDKIQKLNLKTFLKIRIIVVKINIDTRIPRVIKIQCNRVKL